MESTRKLKAFLLLTAIFVFFFTVDWYGKIYKVKVQGEQIDTKISSAKAEKMLGDSYDYTKKYFYRKTNTIKTKNSLIPFIKTKEVINGKTELYSSY